MDKVIPQLAEQLPLKTPEWSAWSANMRRAQTARPLDVSGYQAENARSTARPQSGRPSKEDEFHTETRYVQVRSGETVHAHGQGDRLYGISMARALVEGGDKDGMREVMFLDRDQARYPGRWFTGGYDEIGMDVTMTRMGHDPVVSG